MLLAYVDESYDDDRYWIVALLCPEDCIAALTGALDDVCSRAAMAYRTSSTAELHGWELFHGKGDWDRLATMPRARIAVYRDAFDAIASHPVEIIIRGVNRIGLERRYVRPDHPHAVVLSHLLERIDERAELHHSGTPVLVIADEVDQADHYRRNLWHFQRFATTGYRARRLAHIVDTIHFAPSSASRLVQASDLIAYLWRRIRADADRDERAKRANAALWSRVEPRMVHWHCWHP